MSANDAARIAIADLNHIRNHVRLLAADADQQNRYLHPCGWTRDEPYAHTTDHPPCAPMGELYEAFDDMWPAWREILEPVLNDEIRTALDTLSRSLADFFSVEDADEISTLDGAAWDEVRRVAQGTMSVLEVAGPRM